MLNEVEIAFNHRVSIRQVLHRDIRLPVPVGHNRRADILRARRPEPVHTDPRPDTDHRSEARGAARRAHVRSALERS